MIDWKGIRTVSQYYIDPVKVSMKIDSRVKKNKSFHDTLEEFFTDEEEDERLM